MSAAHITGREAGPDGHMVGRDPRRMSQYELRAMGHEPMSPMEAIRAKCLDCCAGSPNEVRLCVAVTCPSWPFRMGKTPWRAPASEEQLEAMRERGRRLANADKSRHPDAGTVRPVSQARSAVPAPENTSATLVTQ